MKVLNFTKMSGAGNDFILVDNRSGAIKGDLKKLAKKLSDRKHSVGADGLILLERSKQSDIRMRILNPDGSEAEMCGNGVRCLARFAVDQKITGPKLSIETQAGVIYAEVRGEIVKAKMVEPRDLKIGFKVEMKGSREALNFINTGVPHAVRLVSSVSACDVKNLGRAIREHRHFAPNGTNVNFVALRRGNEIDIRTYERGVEDETLACGTGSTAGALVAAAIKNLKSPVLVHTHGGEVLKVYFSGNGSTFYDVYLEGRIQNNFEGRVGL